MKQYITLTQWNELSQKSKEKLVEWSKTCKSFQDEIIEGDYDPFVVILSIGQLIELLDEKAPMFWSIKHQEFTQKNEQFGWSVEDYIVYGSYVDDDELCDALFEAVKEVLESDNT